ncbi:MAG: DMT family transporter [Paracoccaceae bacterium]
MSDRTADIATDRRANLRGSLWMIGAMAAFAVEDSLLKAAARTLPVAEVLILFGLGGALLFAVVARLQGARLFVPEILSPTMRIRAVFEVSGRLFYMLAIALTPLSGATAILQATPIVVVLGAALVFGEKVGWRRWAAILIGLCGVLVIVQPGSEDFSALSILAVLGVIGFAGRDLASRASSAAISATILGFYGFCAVVVAGLLFALYQPERFLWPDPATSLYMSLAILIGVAAYACLMKAMRSGAVSAVTPFRYSRLLFGTALGIWVFGEEPTARMLVGSALIVASGLFIMWRGQRRAVASGGKTD